MRKHPSDPRRDFPFTMEQVGSTYTNSWIFHCSTEGCGSTETIHSRVRLPDQVIKSKINGKGWHAGKDREHDHCPACMGVNRSNILAERFRVVQDGKNVPSVSEMGDHIENIRHSIERAGRVPVEGAEMKPTTIHPVVDQQPQAFPVPVPVLPEARQDPSQQAVEELRNLATSSELTMDLMGRVVETLARIETAMDRLIGLAEESLKRSMADTRVSVSDPIQPAVPSPIIEVPVIMGRKASLIAEIGAYPGSKGMSIKMPSTTWSMHLGESDRVIVEVADERKRVTLKRFDPEAGRGNKVTINRTSTTLTLYAGSSSFLWAKAIQDGSIRADTGPGEVSFYIT